MGSGATNCLVDAGAVILAVRATALASPEEVLKALDSERQQKRPSVPVLISVPGGFRWMPFPRN
jgi:hypothetical protein